MLNRSILHGCCCLFVLLSSLKALGVDIHWTGGGVSPQTDFGQMNLVNVDCNGTLAVVLTNGFVPTNGSSFVLMTYASRTGVFSNLMFPSLPTGGVWTVEYGTNALTVHAPTVNAPPVIIVPPASQTVTLGSNPGLTVTATGWPAPVYQWQFNGGNISGGTNVALTITNFQSGNEGSYRVVVSNALGVVTSAPAVLQANAPVRFGAFGFTNGGFQLQLIGFANTNYIFQWSTNLVAWTSLATNNSPDGFLSFTHTNASPNGCFYRALLP